MDRCEYCRGYHNHVYICDAFAKAVERGEIDDEGNRIPKDLSKLEPGEKVIDPSRRYFDFKTGKYIINPDAERGYIMHVINKLTL